MTSGLDEAAIGRGEAYRVGELGCPRERLEPGPRTASAINSRSSNITEPTVPFSRPRNACIRLFPKALRPVLRHLGIVAETDARLLSSKVSIPVVILCDRTSQKQFHPHGRSFAVSIALECERSRVC